jgi:hypothetical protein
MHRRWIGIRASAVLAIAGSLATLGLGGVMLFGLLVAPRPATGPTAPPFPLAAVGIVMAVLFAGLSVWGICTAIGIFRRRGWARISMVVFAILLTFMGVGAALAILFMPTLPNQEGVSQNLMDTVRWVMAGFYGLLAAIGVWWLVLFNLSRTKEYFAQDGPSEPSARPLSVSVIGWFLLIGALFLGVMAVFRLPVFVFGVVITGWGGQTVYTIFAAVQIYLGTGLLHLQEAARVGTIGYFCLTALSSVLNVAPPGLQAKMETLQKAMPKSFPNGATATMPQPGWVFALMGIAFMALPVWFLVRRRAAFVRPVPAE